jgi:hypothetical protein
MVVSAKAIALIDGVLSVMACYRNLSVNPEKPVPKCVSATCRSKPASQNDKKCDAHDLSDREVEEKNGLEYQACTHKHSEYRAADESNPKF